MGAWGYLFGHSQCDFTYLVNMTERAGSNLFVHQQNGILSAQPYLPTESGFSFPLSFSMLRVKCRLNPEGQFSLKLPMLPLKPFKISFCNIFCSRYIFARWIGYLD
jgi:hypothetical protein